MAVQVIKLLDAIYILDREVLFMEPLKSLMAIFHAMSTNTDTNT